MSVRNYINKSKEDVLFFLKKATADRNSPEYAELFGNLLKMFVDCDKSKNGLVDKEQFSELVDTAAATPRLYGFAPSVADMFKNKGEMETSRDQLFKSMNDKDDAKISFDQFLTYTLTHIACKAAPLEAHPNIETNNKTLYMNNMQLALQRGNDQYTDLYWNLLQIYQSHCGEDFCAGVDEFTCMVEKVVKPARRVGIFSVELKLATLTKVFKKIVRAERMNFNEFLNYCVDHLLKNNAL